MKPGAGESGDEYRRLRSLVVAVYVVLAVSGIAVASFYLYSEYQNALKEARSHSGALTRALGEHVLGTFRSIDTQLRNTGRKLAETRVLERPTNPAIVDLLRQEKPEIDFVRSLYTYDASGRGHTTSLGADISKLHARNIEHFRELLESGTDRLVIGRVIPGAVTKRPSIPIARGILGSDGRFAGIIGTAIEPAYFEKFYGALDPESGASVVLLRSDGAILVRVPGNPNRQADVSEQLFFRNTMAGNSEGTADWVSEFDGIRHLVSYWRIPGWDLIVANDRPYSKVIASLQRLVWAVGFLTSVFLAISVALLRLMLVEVAKRSIGARGLRESQVQLSSIIDSAMDAIITVDESQRIVVFNRAAEAMFGCEAAEALGQPLGRFIPERFRVAHDAQIQAFGASGKTVRAMGRPGAIVGLRADGEEFAVEATIARAEADGRRLYTVMLRDIVGRIAAAEAQRDVLVREVHHRIKNNLQGVIGLVRQQVVAHPELEGLVEDMVSQVRAIAVVHGMHSERAQGEIMLCELVSEISLATMAITKGAIAVEGLGEGREPVRLAKDEAVPLALVLNELLLNAIKHGRPEAAGDGVRVKVSAEDGVARVSISNLGAFAAADFDFEKGVGLGTGLNLVKALLPKNGARLEIVQEGERVAATLTLSEPVTLRS